VLAPGERLIELPDKESFVGEGIETYFEIRTNRPIEMLCFSGW
jgi:hypothetical protein